MNARTANGPGRVARLTRDPRFSTLVAGIVWAVVVLMVVPPTLDYTNTMADDGNVSSRVILLFVMASGLTVALMQPALALRVLRNTNVYYLAFIGLAIASMVWSIDPGLTARRLFRLAIQCSAFVAIAIAAWHPHRFANVVRPITTLLLLGSLVFGWMRPDLAIHHENQPELLGSWHGLATQKNILGSMAAFGSILWLHGRLTRTVGWASFLVGISASLACLLLSRSSTSLMATLLAGSAMFLLTRAPGSMRKTMPVLVGALGVITLLYALAMLRVVPGLQILLAPIPMITGKDLTFSGRAEIWAAVVDHIRMRPWLGSGYGAYWGGPIPGTESYSIKAVLFGFYPASAHNGILDVLNDLGTLGLVCLVAYLLRYLRDALHLYQFDRAQGALFVAIFLYQIIINLSESCWLNVTRLDFVYMSLATLSLSRALLETRSPARPASAPGPSHRAATVADREPAAPSVLLPRPVGTARRPRPFARRT